MSKGKKIGLIVLITVVIVGIIGFIIARNSLPGNVGIDNNLTNEKGKTGSTNLDSSKVLVVYFSQSGNTQKLAKLISDRVGGDFVRIETVQTYPTEYNELADFAKKERDNNIKPKLKDLGINIDDYDTIFIGYPIWWYQMPMPMYTFFDTYDFDGKTIVPFNTHEGSGDGGTYDDIKKLEPNLTVLEGLPIRGGDMTKDQSNKVDNWLKELGFIR
ncbi:Flavodoxin [Kandleria vitulina]|uniref:flavodoxin n=1 Tax=Kandleria vitulina TaxID=1630 RepID=UPI0008C066BB|nr:flavodoxin [Kandleria vitulina]SEI94058.1 Flavodoxin [Kandleria vitulina]